MATMQDYKDLILKKKEEIIDSHFNAIEEQKKRTELCREAFEEILELYKTVKNLETRRDRRFYELCTTCTDTTIEFGTFFSITAYCIEGQDVRLQLNTERHSNANVTKDGAIEAFIDFIANTLAQSKILDMKRDYVLKAKYRLQDLNHL